MKRRKICLAVAFVAITFAAATVQADKPVPSGSDLDVALSLQTAIENLAEQVGPTVVNIEITRAAPQRFSFRMPAPDKLPPEWREYFERFHEFDLPEDIPELEMKANASGIIISEDGYILTNEHVVRDAKEFLVTLANKDKYDAKVVGTDARRDLAVLKIEAKNLPVVKLGSSEPIRRGMFVVALGSPFGFGRDGQASISFGIVSGTGRFVPSVDIMVDRYYGNLIQTDAAINPGNSGGPLCNLKGEVIGVNTAITTLTGASQGVGLAIPITAETTRIIERLMKGEEIEYGFLGVEIKSPTLDESKAAGAKQYTGALIVNVLPDMPAAEAGLKAGDIVIKIDGKDIETPDDLIRIVGAMPIGQKAKLTFLREGKEQTVEVKIAKRPSLVMVSGRPSEPWRGISVRNLTDQDRRQLGLNAKATGALVVSVTKGSSGEEAGIEPGMVIDRVGNQKVENVEQFEAAIEKVHDVCTVHILGKGVKLIKAEEAEELKKKEPKDEKDKPEEGKHK